MVILPRSDEILKEGAVSHADGSAGRKCLIVSKRFFYLGLEYDLMLSITLIDFDR